MSDNKPVGLEKDKMEPLSVARTERIALRLQCVVARLKTAAVMAASLSFLACLQACNVSVRSSILCHGKKPARLKSK